MSSISKIKISLAQTEDAVNNRCHRNNNLHWKRMIQDVLWKLLEIKTKIRNSWKFSKKSRILSIADCIVRIKYCQIKAGEAMHSVQYKWTRLVGANIATVVYTFVCITIHWHSSYMQNKRNNITLYLKNGRDEFDLMLCTVSPVSIWVYFLLLYICYVAQVIKVK